MANFTKYAIKATFIQLLEERPLRDITVKDIVERCGINRNSFYYHFQDIAALLEEIIKDSADAVIKKYPSVHSAVECYDALTTFASEHKSAIMHIYRSVSREVFERYLMNTSKYFIETYVNMAVEAKLIKTEDKEIVTECYKCLCFGLIMDWLNNGMKPEDIRKFRKIFLVKVMAEETTVSEEPLL